MQRDTTKQVTTKASTSSLFGALDKYDSNDNNNNYKKNV